MRKTTKKLFLEILGRNLCILCSLCLLPCLLWASNQPTIILDNKFSQASIANQVCILEDTQKKLTIDQIKMLDADKFQRVTSPNLSFGHRRNSNIWVKIPLENKEVKEQFFFLTTGNVYIRYIDFYAVQNKQLLTHFKGACRKTFLSVPFLFGNLFFLFL